MNVDETNYFEMVKNAINAQHLTGFVNSLSLDQKMLQQHSKKKEMLQRLIEEDEQFILDCICKAAASSDEKEIFSVGDTVIVSRRIEKDQECFEPGTIVYIVSVSDKGYDIRDHRGTQINEIDFDCVQSQKSDCKRWYTMHLHAEESFQGNVLLTPKEASIVADAITQLYANGTGGSWCGSVSIDTSRYRFDKFDYGEDDDEDWD